VAGLVRRVSKVVPDGMSSACRFSVTTIDQEEEKKRDDIKTAELDGRDQVTATVPGPVLFEKREQRSIIR